MRPRERRRVRRGSIERPVSGRLYRATWALLALPLLVTAFTVGRPSPLPAPPLPPSFDQATAARLALDFAKLFPDRRPGTEAAARATDWVAERLADYELVVERRTAPVDVPGRGPVELVNLVAFPAGREEARDAIVVLAHRDNLGLSPGPDDNASGTAALIELARNLSRISLGHTIILVSADGGAYGNAGAAALADDPDFRERVLAVVDLDSLAARRPPRLQFAGDAPRTPPGELLATAEASILAQSGSSPDHPAALDQLLDLAFPFSFYGQSPFIAAGISAVTLTAAGDRPPEPAQDTAATFDAASLGMLGRSAQALVLSLDSAAEIATGTTSDLYLGGRFVRGFAIAFLYVVALLPVLVATVDLTARVYRRGVPLAPAVRSYGLRLVTWGFVAGLAAIFAAFGLFPKGAARPLSPDAGPGVDWPIGALLGFAAISGIAWLLARSRLVPLRPTPRAEELAGHVVAMLALCAVSLGLAIVNPFSLILVLPSLHLWLWAPHLRDAAPVLRALVYGLGFAGPLAVVVSFAVRFDLGLDAPWYVAALFSVGYAPLALFVAAVPWAAAAAQIGALLFGRYAPLEPPAGGRGSGKLEEPDVGSRGQLPASARDENERVRLGSRDDHV